MKIVSLTAENIKRLVAVHIEPNGNVVEITGKNGQGKTSVLDSIWWCLAGAENIQRSPIRTGANEAQIKLKLAGGGRELIVLRKFRRAEDKEFTTSLQVLSADGATFKSPQKLLDELLGELAFDPLAFDRSTPKEQFDELKTFVPDVDFEQLEGLNRSDYERRTDVNRLAREARAAANMITVPADTPDEPIDEAALTTELQAAGTLNQDVERRKALRVQAAKDVESYRAQAQAITASIDDGLAEIDQRFKVQIRGLEAQIEALQRQIEGAHQACNTEQSALRSKRQTEAATATAAAEALQAKLDQAEELPAIIDTNAIAAKLNQARTINANVERKRQKAAHLATATKYEAESEQLTANIEARNKAKLDAVAKADIPVRGITFGDGIVLLNGVPFEQASDAERLRASVAIAMAKNPKLRVIRIRDGSLLDDDAMKILAEMADKADMQVWIERVDSSGAVGFVLEDGHVRQAEAAAARSAA